MSYILEALKKAESERQLGSPPGLHAAPMQSAPPASAPRTRMALAAGAVVLALGAFLLAWLKWPGPTPVNVAVAPAPVPVTAAASALASAPAPVPKAAHNPAPELDSPLFSPAPPAPPAPVAAAPREPAPVTAVPPAPADAAMRTPPPPVEQPAPEETYPLQRDLPEAVARELPQVAIGGYIYSKTPAERLLLVDKVLRHEGEEVAPGLVLEKLLPKSAVFSYRGLRYRVAY